MATTEAQDGSEHVTDFLKRIKELGEQRDQEDSERTRRLEEQIYEARRQREERRKERARSLSPTKQTSATPRSLPSPQAGLTSSPLSQPRPLQSLNDALEEKPDANASGRAAFLTSREEASKPIEATSNSSSATSLARAKTLSWQQRPSGPRARPAAFLGRREPEMPAAAIPNSRGVGEEPSKADIAKSLAAKDPTWFRQTADRGVGSAALRRNDSVSAESTPSQKRQLHGMSAARETPERDESLLNSSATPTSGSPSFTGSIRGRPTTSEADSSILTDATIYESIENKPEYAPTGSMRGHHRSESESTIGRRNNDPLELSGSPTKGMGGFVQSAMMRRTDSVSRFWNVPTGNGLSRHNSSASFSDRPASRDRNANLAPAMPPVDESNTFKRPLSRDNNSRPGSSYDRFAVSSQAEDDSLMKPPPLSRSPSKTATTDPREGVDSGVKSPYQGLRSSPSKRWSPTKSSWLESALNKPDMPKAKLAPPSQPAWMADLQKNRQQRQSKDLGKDAGADLGRSAPLWGAALKSPSRAEQPPPSLKTETEQSADVKSEVPHAQTTTSEVEDLSPATVPLPKAKPPRLSRSPAPEDSTDQEQEAAKAQSPGPQIGDVPEPLRLSKPQQTSAPSTSASITPPQLTQDRGDDSSVQYPSQFEAKLHTRPKPSTPPKKDFRSNLKPRTDTPTKSQTDNPEFLNGLGKLRRADTEKYVAPDVLGDNIRRGKAGLAITGGPKPRERRDEFKDSLIEQKQKMKEKVGDLGGTKPPVPDKRQASIPEALRKRQALGRNDSNANVMNKPSPEKAAASTTTNAAPSTINRGASPIKDPTPQTTGTPQPTVSAKLANRFNPAIANVIARGPPSPERSQDSARASSPLAKIRSAPAQMSDGPLTSKESAQPLEHKTKGRARGPKRRLPKTQEAAGGGSAAASPQGSPRIGVGAKPAIRSSSRNVNVGGGSGV